MPITKDDIEAVGSLVLDLCGIVLDETKGYLIESRLAPLLRSAGASTYYELAQKARTQRDESLHRRIIDAITTNETLFFRDAAPFEALRHKALPELIDAKAKSTTPRRLRIWSAACSTGQEAYSIAMVLRELIPDLPKWDVQILGTDVSDAAVQAASRGCFTNFEMERGVSAGARQSHFVRDAAGWRVRDDVRALTSFRKLNLLEPFPNVGTFDVIFCRNVAIYFTAAARKSLFLRLKQQLYAGGYLFVGSSESLLDIGPEFAPKHHCRSVFYQPRPLSPTASK
jgi:chemotaxis protein methyltransferase CheR